MGGRAGRRSQVEEEVEIDDNRNARGMIEAVKMWWTAEGGDGARMYSHRAAGDHRRRGSGPTDEL